MKKAVQGSGKGLLSRALARLCIQLTANDEISLKSVRKALFEGYDGQPVLIAERQTRASFSKS